MKSVTRLATHARARPLFMLLCGVASVAAPAILFVYVEALNASVQRGEELRRLQRAGGSMSSAGIIPFRHVVKPDDAQTNSAAGRVSRAVRAS